MTITTALFAFVGSRDNQAAFNFLWNSNGLQIKNVIAEFSDSDLDLLRSQTEGKRYGDFSKVNQLFSQLFGAIRNEQCFRSTGKEWHAVTGYSTGNAYSGEANHHDPTNIYQIYD